ncbi:MAG: protein phosphatase 2C domain-containing protein [Erysipelotrichaceae bacterium]|nr:protein phosphatase 2C domain-containing protein [Erysipelotrichaceae bacterium]
MEYCGITDIGLVREKNQDAFITIENKYGDVLALVADGIGGARAGEVASSECIKYFGNIFNESGPFDDLDSAINFLNHHISIANQKINDLSKAYEEYTGMGTTLTGILLTKHGALSINIGDSRVYGFLDDKAFALTKDHSLINQMIDAGEITEEEAINHPKRHYLTKAMGIFDSITADIHKVKDMEYYLCCSDGLHGYCDLDEIKNIVFMADKSLNDKCVELKDLALLKGGFDNITAVLVKI